MFHHVVAAKRLLSKVRPGKRIDAWPLGYQPLLIIVPVSVCSHSVVHPTSLFFLDLLQQQDEPWVTIHESDEHVPCSDIC